MKVLLINAVETATHRVIVLIKVLTSSCCAHGESVSSWAVSKLRKHLMFNWLQSVISRLLNISVTSLCSDWLIMQYKQVIKIFPHDLTGYFAVSVFYCEKSTLDDLQPFVALQLKRCHLLFKCTWMSEAAAGICLLKCFCLCFCWTFRANPEPKIP